MTSPRMEAKGEVIDMTLYDLIQCINDGMSIHLYDSGTGDSIGIYEGKEDIPEEYEDCDVVDIFGESASTICIEIETEEEE